MLFHFSQFWGCVLPLGFPTKKTSLFRSHSVQEKKYVFPQHLFTSISSSWFPFRAKSYLGTNRRQHEEAHATTRCLFVGRYAWSDWKDFWLSFPAFRSAIFWLVVVSIHTHFDAREWVTLFLLTLSLRLILVLGRRHSPGRKQQLADLPSCRIRPGKRGFLKISEGVSRTLKPFSRSTVVGILVLSEWVMQFVRWVQLLPCGIVG